MNLNERMNRTMHVLTIVATLFIPLSFFAGVYGMNFDVIPELGWKYGYLAFWVICFVVIVFQLWMFRRRRWI